MKKSVFLFILTSLISLSACSRGEAPLPTDTNLSEETSESSSSSSSSSSKESSSSSSKEDTKKIVAAHTLKDTNPPINPKAKGEVVNQDTWDSFKYAPQVSFNGNYNYTYEATSGETVEKFTKNGYYMKTYAGELYYERKSGNTFYMYSKTNEGYLRDETSLDLVDKYTYRIHNEIYLHMFKFEDYTYNTNDGTYTENAGVYTSIVKFVGGYLVYLYYTLGSFSFKISASFETEINIPESYYYVD